MVREHLQHHLWHATDGVLAGLPPGGTVQAGHGPGRPDERHLIWEETFGGGLEDRERAIKVFELHNEEVKERVPPDKLLVYEVKEGWEPLCKFLGVEVPKNKPFPHLNDTDTFRKMIRRRLTFALAAPMVVLSLAGLMLLLRRRRRR